jgi:hypothetical protein
MGEDADRFRSFLMRAAWLINMTRPDCLVVLAFLSQRMHCSTKQDMKKLDRLVEYVASTIDHGITIDPGNDLNVYLYTDSSIGIFPFGRSVSGGAEFIGNAPIWWSSRKSPVVAKSAYEGEILACSDFASHAIFTRELLESIGIKQKPLTIYTDSASAIAGYEAGRPKQLTARHISIRQYWIAERRSAQELRLVHCSLTFRSLTSARSPWQEKSSASYATGSWAGNSTLAQSWSARTTAERPTKTRKRQGARKRGRNKGRASAEGKRGAQARKKKGARKRETTP